MRCAEHAPARAVHNGIRVVSCAACGEITFRGSGGGPDPLDAVAKLFADFRLVGRVDTIRAPAGDVLAYRPSRASDTQALGVIPPHRWFEVTEHLWMCHDGALLLLAHRLRHVSLMLGA